MTEQNIKYRINIDFVLIIALSVVLMIPSTLTQRFTGVFSFNILLSGIVLISVLLIAVISGHSLYSYLNYLLLFLVFIVNIFLSSETLSSLKNSIYFISAVLVLIIVQKPHFLVSVIDTVRKYRIIFLSLIIVSHVILIISLFTPSAYVFEGGYENKTLFFAGFTNSEHALASCMTLLMALILCLSSVSHHKLLFSLFFPLPLYALFQSGARTFIITGGIILVLFLFNTIKRKALLSLSIFIFIAGMTAFYLYSNMSQKTSIAINNPYVNSRANALFNGRLELWTYDLKEYFKNFSFINKVFGKGFDYPFLFHESVIGRRLWSHNDIINLFLSTGLLGVFIYSVNIIIFIFRIKLNNIITNPFLIFLIGIFVIAPLILNGYYIYTNLVFSLVFITAACIKKQEIYAINS